MPKLKLKINVYDVVDRAVEEGVRAGYSKSFKHTDQPDEDLVVQTVVDYVMNRLCEVVNFE